MKFVRSSSTTSEEEPTESFEMFFLITRTSLATGMMRPLMVEVTIAPLGMLMMHDGGYDMDISARGDSSNVVNWMMTITTRPGNH